MHESKAKMTRGPLHSTAQGDASPGDKLLVGEDRRNVAGHAARGCGRQGQFPRVLHRDLSLQDDLVLRPWRQH